MSEIKVKSWRTPDGVYRWADGIGDLRWTAERSAIRKIKDHYKRKHRRENPRVRERRVR